MNKLKEKWIKVPIGVKAAAVYTAATLFSKGLAIITTPIFTRIMTTGEVGVVGLYNSWHSIIGAIATLSLTSGGFAVAMKEYPDRRDQYQSSVLSLTSVIALILALVYFVCPPFWNNVTGLPTELMLLMLFGFLVTPARDFWLARQRYEYKYKLSGIIMFASAIVASILSIIVVLKLRRFENADVASGRLFANYLILYGVAAVLWIVLIVKGKVFYNKTFWTESLKISIPLVGYSIASQILSASDRIMIGNMVDNDAVGIYSTLYTVSSLSLLVWSSINMSFVPFLFRNIDDNEEKTRKVSLLLLSVFSCIAVLMTFFAPEIVKILATEEYYEAIYIMPPIAAGVFFTSVANLYSNIVVNYKKSQFVMYPALISAVLNVVLNYIFIPIFGYEAAAYTTLFSYVLLALLQAVWANKVRKDITGKNIHVYNDKAIMLLSVLTVIVTLSGLLLYRNTIVRYAVILVLFGITAVLARKVISLKKQNNNPK